MYIDPDLDCTFFSEFLKFHKYLLPKFQKLNVGIGSLNSVHSIHPFQCMNIFQVDLSQIFFKGYK